jgi:ABC-type uncharacterized transport system substrate-binding protein
MAVPWRATQDRQDVHWGPSSPDQWQCSAPYMHKLLGGAKSSDLPVEQPARFELIINLNTANALGLPIPPWLLHQADEIIQ